MNDLQGTFELIDQHLTAFLVLLKQERLLLEKNKILGLSEMSSKKVLLLTELEQLNQAQQQLLISAGCSPDFSGLKKWLSSLSKENRQQIISLLKKIKSLTLLCQEENKINGAIILISQQQNVQLLELIFKKPQNLTYGADAKAVRASHQRSIYRV